MKFKKKNGVTCVLNLQRRNIKRKKNYTSGASTAMQYKSAWQFYTSLQFLSDVVSLRNTVTSLDFNDTSTQERSAEVTSHSEEMFDMNDFEDTEETQRELCHTQTLPQLKRHTSNTTTSNKKQKHDHIYTAATTTLGRNFYNIKIKKHYSKYIYTVRFLCWFRTKSNP
ncbi:uncharacterized protein LOC118205945 [Stegodyphus dumicola]|uniref:uncharacterized protein LOC118205945 n=1 Tax=Stegodyphus dumicola TaxID=202533 RepID=UPI0015ABC2DB|nr:uncharacterized protein LOC118205945 [Stegodyphus dumicola]